MRDETIIRHAAIKIRARSGALTHQRRLLAHRALFLLPRATASLLSRQSHLRSVRPTRELP